MSGHSRRRRRDAIRIDMKHSTDALIQERVRPLLPRGVIYWNAVILEAVVRAAYVQGAMDALTITERHPELIAAVRATP